MAIIEFPRQEPGPTLGARIGAGAAEGLSSGIGALIDMKLERMKKQQKVNALSDSLKGLVQQKIITEEEAPMLANMALDAPQVANMYLKDRIESSRSKQYADAQNRARGLDALQGMRQQGGMPSGQDQRVSQDQDTQAAQMQAAPQRFGQTGGSYEYNPTLTPAKNEENKNKFERQQVEQGKLQVKRAQLELNKEEKKLDRAQKDKEHKLNVDKFYNKKKSESYTRNKGVLKEIRSAAKEAKDVKFLLRRGLDIAVKNKLGSPLFQSGLKTAKLDYDFLKKKDASELSQIGNIVLGELIKNSTGKMPKALIDVLKAQTFDVTQTPKQIVRRIENLLKMGEVPIERQKIAGKLIDDNDGIVPDNFNTRIEEKLDPIRDKIMSDYFESLNDTDKEKLKAAAGEENIDRESEGWGGWLARNLTRSGARAIESVVGLPGNLLEGVKSLSDLSSNMFGIEKKLGLDKYGANVERTMKIPGLTPLMQYAKDYLSEKAGKEVPLPTEVGFPTAKEVKHTIRKLGELFSPKAKSYLKPKGGFENFTDAAVSDLAPMLLGVAAGPASAFKSAAISALKMAGFINIAPTLAKELGVGKTGQSVVRVGSALLATLHGKLSVKKMVDKIDKGRGFGMGVRNAMMDKKVRSMTMLQREEFFNTGVKHFSVGNELKKEFDAANTIGSFIKDNLTIKAGSSIERLFSSWLRPIRGLGGAVAEGLTAVGNIESTMRMLSRHQDIRADFVRALQFAADKNKTLFLSTVSKIGAKLDKKDKNKKSIKPIVKQAPPKQPKEDKEDNARLMSRFATY